MAEIALAPTGRFRTEARLDNGDIAELLAQQAEKSEGHVVRALRRASSAAFLWPVEAADLLNQGQSLTVLPSIGPYLERQIRQWIEDPPGTIQRPHIRSHFLTLSRARQILGSHPEFVRRYRGDLQMHSQWSDGAGTIADMAAAANQRGYQYIGITDHSKGLKIAGGIDEPELREQAAEIDQLNRHFSSSGVDFRVLRSVELNLNPRGEGDLDPGAFNGLDLVVGSFHSKLREQEDQTGRYLAALENPFVDILGHPVGRIYNHREGLKADWERVCARAAELDKALEVDSYPDRQDLNVELLRIARGEGTRIAIDTDAHSPDQLAFVELGLAAALEAGIPEQKIINYLPAPELIAWAAGGGD